MSYHVDACAIVEPSKGIEKSFRWNTYNRPDGSTDFALWYWSVKRAFADLGACAICVTSGHASSRARETLAIMDLATSKFPFLGG